MNARQPSRALLVAMIVLVVALGGSVGIGAKGAGPLPGRALAADDAEKPSGVRTLLGDPASASGDARLRANGLIAFASGYAFRISGPHAVSQIWVVKPNGRGLRRLTESSVSSAYPAWSPDGKKIAFFRDSADDYTKNYLFVMNADGSGQRRLASTEDAGAAGEPAWSPDGKKIAYYDAPFIDTINANGTGQRRLTTEERDRSDPSWSPDGHRIVFMYANNPRQDLHVMNADGSRERLLVSQSPIDCCPRWSPDGKKIAFLGGPPARDREAIYLMNADGSDLHRLTKGSPVWAFGFGLAWAPDGKEVAFTGVAPGRAVDVYLMTADATHIHRLTNMQQVGYGVSWQPIARP